MSTKEVGEIFLAASSAFKKLGDMTKQLRQTNNSSGEAEWTKEDIGKLKSSIVQFTDDLEGLSETIIKRNREHMNATIDKALENYPMDDLDLHHSESEIGDGTVASEVTLNMLNASDGEAENAT